MCCWTDKLPLSIQRILPLLAGLHCIFLAVSASNEFMPLTVRDSCPGDVLTYTCTINGSGNTIWSGTAFNCETKMNEIILRHSQFNESGSSGNCNDGAIMAQSLRVINNTCYSSQLNVTVDLDMNNKTIQCSHSFETITTIREATIFVATAPPANVKLSEVRPRELTFNWSASANRLTKLNYTINSNCGTCPNMTNTTMITCSDIDVSTTLTMCTFSVRRVACNTIGNPSPPFMVTLRVPDTPNMKVIPQYSLSNDKQSLTKIIVRVEQNMTSFDITDTISGSITSYIIVYGGKMQKRTACLEDNCEYTVDLPSSICSISSESDVDVTVAAANLLGFGQPTEPITIECNSQFARVDYYPMNTSISCTFLNRVDSSPKSCSVLYGTCGQEMYTVQGNSIDGSPFMSIIKLNSSNIKSTDNCYIVMASNGTYEIKVNGSINLPISEGSSAVLSAIIIPVILVAFGVITATVIGVIILLWRRRQYFGGRAEFNAENVQNYELKELEELLSQYKHLYPINSKHFTKSTLTSKCTLKKFRKQNKLDKNDLIFLEYKFKPTDVQIRDVILQYKNGDLYTGPDARDMVSDAAEGLSKWKSVFVLPHSGITQKISAGALVLYQNPMEKRVKFKVLVVQESSTLIDFMGVQKISSTEKERVFYELSPADEGLSLLHYVEVATIDESKQLGEGSIVPLDSGIHYFYTELKAPGVNINHPGKGLRVFIQGTTSSLEQKSLTVGSLVLYKATDKAGTGMTADDHVAITNQ